MTIFQPVKLTGSEARLLAFVRAYLLEHGYPPTLREICVGIGMSPRPGAWVTTLRRNLERKGMITLEPSNSRAIKLVLSRGTARVAREPLDPSADGALHRDDRFPSKAVMPAVPDMTFDRVRKLVTSCGFIAAGPSGQILTEPWIAAFALWVREETGPIITKGMRPSLRQLIYTNRRRLFSRVLRTCRRHPGLTTELEVLYRLGGIEALSQYVLQINWQRYRPCS